MMDPRLLMVVKQLAQVFRQRKWRMATAESCTGGMIAEICTDQAGSSRWFDSGIVTYSNEAKSRLLGIDPVIIDKQGAVSQQVVELMAEGVLNRTGSQAVVAVSGIAGPDGGSEQKPVGTVWIGWAIEGQPIISKKFHFDGNRQSVRKQTAEQALAGLLDLVKNL